MAKKSCEACKGSGLCRLCKGSGRKGSWVTSKCATCGGSGNCSPLWRFRPEIGPRAIKRLECKENDPSVESGVTRVTLCATGHSSPTRAGRWSSIWRPAQHATVTVAASVAAAPAPSGSGSRTAATPAVAGACAAGATAAVRSRAVRAAAGGGDGPPLGRARRSRVIAGMTSPV